MELYRYSPPSFFVAPPVAQTIKRLPAIRRPGFGPWVRKILWRRKWQPTPVLLPGKSHGWKSLVGCSPWFYLFSSNWDSLVAQSVKNLPAMQETWVRSLGQEDPLEKEMATHSSILAWRIPWTEEPGGLQSTRLQRVGHDFTFTFIQEVKFSHLYCFLRIHC